MRATVFLMLCFILLGAILWATLSGAWFVLGCVFLLLALVITLGYPDTMILFLLGAREVRSSDEKNYYEAASQEAYKLSLKMPKIYFYDGSLERAFVLQKGNEISIILDRKMMERSTIEELRAVCFELLLQVKKGLASKRTKTMFALGFFAWIIHSLFSLVVSILPFKDLQKAVNWILSFFLQPLLELLFGMMMGGGYFKKLEALLSEFPNEKEALQKVGMRISKPTSYYSLPSRKLLEFASSVKSKHYQNIMALEFLPHEWDYLFNDQELKHA